MTTFPTDNSTSHSTQVPLHKKFSRQVSKSKHKQKPQPNLEQQALAIISAGTSEFQVLSGLLQLAIGSVGGIGGFVAAQSQEHWYLSKQKPTIGKIPSASFFDEGFSQQCETFLRSGEIQTWACETLEGVLMFSIPLNRDEDAAELMLILSTTEASIVESTQRLTRIASAMRLWINANAAQDANWQVHSLASIIAMVSQIETRETLNLAAEETANLMANHLPVASAAIGMLDRHLMTLKAISGVSKMDPGSEISRSWLQAMVESQTRKQPGLFPAVDQENNFLLQSHRRLASNLQAEAAFSQPLVAEDGEEIGSIVFVGEQSQLQSESFQRFVATSAPALAAALRSAKQRQKGKLSRAKSWVLEKMHSMPGAIALAAVFGFVLLMMLPVTYRVRCSAITEPVSRRFAVAPFAGQIIEGHVEAGDFVTKGQLLAELDGRSIRWELFGVSAEREQSITSRQMELSERNIAKVKLAELEHDRLQSKEEVLKYKQEHLQVCSPIDGIVLSGSLERAEAASVETGQTLFEIGPMKPMRIEIEIPANEVAQTKPGFPVSIWINGQENEVIEGSILKIHPRSTTRNAKNVFVAEVEFPNEDERLRPGMKGTVRIDCEKRSLGWSLFHKPINWLKANFSYF
ncbi:efflux RND transporter periplasmic adaptor subunit [Mariniblastus fucicola]|uniref:Macrolide transporter subunit MacA n=1 Tax=Mariniblastus fucicola TaxID=980251 RepID=A0A5B9PI30_9BACT|nr:HlyD family efflux transporter periplasmic adaptor subunit [Mariniblastus fucicola]QEG24332.1 macrolide transporter subunit MacA [Mariniblastus fucicola]